MKKLLTIVLILCCLLGLAACDPGMGHLNKEELLENTVKIELYLYENTDPKQVRLGGKETPIFDFSKATFIAALDDSLMEDVAEDIALHDLFLFNRTLNEPIGKTLVLHQKNGNMLVLFSCVYQNKQGGTRYYGYCNLYDQNGVFIDYLGDIGSDYVDDLESRFFEKTG